MRYVREILRFSPFLAFDSFKIIFFVQLYLQCSVEMGTQSEIYATFVLRVVGEEDNTRSIWPSSPSVSGWKTGVQSIDGKPNGNLLTTATATSSKNHTLESHGPYWHGSSDTNPAVNGPLDGSGKFKANIPVAFHYSNPESLLRGPAFQNQFVSFCFTCMSYGKLRSEVISTFLIPHLHL